MLISSSPWGAVQSEKQFFDGCVMVSTAGHGGMFVSDEVAAEITDALGFEYQTFIGSPNWFEEDCDAAVVVVALFAKFSHEKVYSCWKALSCMSQWTYGIQYAAVVEAMESNAEFMKIIESQKLQKADMWSVGGMSSKGNGWSVHLHKPSGESKVVKFKEYPTKTYYYDNELAGA